MKKKTNPRQEEDQLLEQLLQDSAPGTILTSDGHDLCHFLRGKVCVRYPPDVLRQAIKRRFNTARNLLRTNSVRAETLRESLGWADANRIPWFWQNLCEEDGNFVMQRTGLADGNAVEVTLEDGELAQATMSILTVTHELGIATRVMNTCIAHAKGKRMEKALKMVERAQNEAERRNGVERETADEVEVPSDGEMWSVYPSSLPSRSPFGGVGNEDDLPIRL